MKLPGGLSPRRAAIALASLVCAVVVAVCICVGVWSARRAGSSSVQSRQTTVVPQPTVVIPSAVKPVPSVGSGEVSGTESESEAESNSELGKQKAKPLKSKAGGKRPFKIIVTPPPEPPVVDNIFKSGSNTQVTTGTTHSTSQQPPNTNPPGSQLSATGNNSTAPGSGTGGRPEATPEQDKEKARQSDDEAQSKAKAGGEEALDAELSRLALHDGSRDASETKILSGTPPDAVPRYPNGYDSMWHGRLPPAVETLAVLPRIDSQPPGVLGLRNGFAYCFANSTLQLLLAVAPVVRHYVPGAFGRPVVPDRAEADARMASFFAQAFGAAEREAAKSALAQAVARHHDAVQAEEAAGAFESHMRGALFCDEHYEHGYSDARIAAMDADAEIKAAFTGQRETQRARRQEGADAEYTAWRGALRPTDLYGSLFTEEMARFAAGQHDISEFAEALLGRLAPSVRAAFLYGAASTSACVHEGERTDGASHCAASYDCADRHVFVNVRGGGAESADIASLLNAEAAPEVVTKACAAAGCSRTMGMRRTRICGPAPAVLALRVVRFAYDSNTGEAVRLPFPVVLAPVIGLRTDSPPAHAKHTSTTTLAWPCDAASLGGGAQFASVSDLTDAHEEYRLAGVGLHDGAGPTQGHYVAATRSLADGRWYLHDDARTTPITPGGTTAELQAFLGRADVSAQVYVALYERVLRAEPAAVDLVSE